MNRSELEKLFGNLVEIEELAHYTEADVNQYLIETGYEGDPSEIVRSIRNVIAAATLGRMTSARKAASSRENGKKGGRPRK